MPLGMFPPSSGKKPAQSRFSTGGGLPINSPSSQQRPRGSVARPYPSIPATPEPPSQRPSSTSRPTVSAPRRVAPENISPVPRPPALSNRRPYPHPSRPLSGRPAISRPSPSGGLGLGTRPNSARSSTAGTLSRTPVADDEQQLARELAQQRLSSSSASSSFAVRPESSRVGAQREQYERGIHSRDLARESLDLDTPTPAPNRNRNPNDGINSASRAREHVADDDEVPSGPAPGRGKGGKGLGKGIAKRHRKTLRDNIQAITKPSIRRLARRGGVKRISGQIYEEIRGVMKIYMEKILKDCVTYCEHARRKTVTVVDVVHALRRIGRPIYGFDPDTYDGGKRKRERRLLIARR
ncbi:Core component of nucleosome [Orbilia ellipsospora]|uniref:Histone H4 n=1 Tax=Orbilia ellipsospora TaxID=2528407 RepID=A0AAV9XSS9_9PEZI